MRRQNHDWQIWFSCVFGLETGGHRQTWSPSWICLEYSACFPLFRHHLHDGGARWMERNKKEMKIKKNKFNQTFRFSSSDCVLEFEWFLSNLKTAFWWVDAGGNSNDHYHHHLCPHEDDDHHHNHLRWESPIFVTTAKINACVSSSTPSQHVQPQQLLLLHHFCLQRFPSIIHTFSHTFFQSFTRSVTHSFYNSHVLSIIHTFNHIFLLSLIVSITHCFGHSQYQSQIISINHSFNHLFLQSIVINLEPLTKQRDAVCHGFATSRGAHRSKRHHNHHHHYPRRRRRRRLPPPTFCSKIETCFFLSEEPTCLSAWMTH